MIHAGAKNSRRGPNQPKTSLHRTAMTSVLANSTTTEILAAANTFRTERERLYNLRKGRKRQRPESSATATTSTATFNPLGVIIKRPTSIHVVDQSQYGKYGIISISDLGNKRPEFDAWCRHKEINVTTALKSKADLMRYFKDFIEDYNTASMPHEKFYDLHVYENKRQRLEQHKPKVMTNNESLMADDTIHKRQLQNQASSKAKIAAAYKSLTSVSDLKFNMEKLKAMKAQELLRARQKQAYSMQDTATLKKITRQLEPDEITNK